MPSQKDTSPQSVTAIEAALALFSANIPKGKEFLVYFKSNIKDLLVQQSQAIVEEALPGSWTNNNSESINKVLKDINQHKIVSIPQLIENLYSLSDRQIKDLQRALYGEGAIF